MEKRRKFRQEDVEDPSIGDDAGDRGVDYDDDKKGGAGSKRRVAFIISVIILIALSIVVLSRKDILHLALIQNTGDYHTNHVHEKIEANRLVIAERPNSNSGHPEDQYLSANVIRIDENKKIVMDNEFLKPRASASPPQPHSSAPILQSTLTVELQKDRKKSTLSTLAVPLQTPQPQLRVTSVDKAAVLKSVTTTPQPVDDLQTHMEKQIALVRQMKFEKHLVMEKDPNALREIAILQPLVRQFMRQHYGPEPYFVEMTLAFPLSMSSTHSPASGTIVIEMAPLDLVPYSVYYFLSIVDNWKGGSFHRKAGHVLQAMVNGGRQQSLAFQEYNAGYPHVKHTMGYAGRPGGPGFYISTVDNSECHGPGSQGSKTEADSVFGRIIRGFDVVEHMKKQPGATGAGFINDPSNFIKIPSMRLMSPDEAHALLNHDTQ